MRRARRSGWILADALLALMIIAAAFALLVTTQSRMTRAQRHLADQRQATRAAAGVLLALQSGAALPKDAETTFAVTPLPDPAVTGWRWVSVRATRNRSGSELIGLVRETP